MKTIMLCPCGSEIFFENCCYNRISKPKNGTLRLAYSPIPSDDFHWRMIFQIAKIRNCVYKENDDRKKFDNLHEIVFQNLIEAKLATEEALKLIEEYRNKVEERKIVKYDKETISVEEVIDDELNFLFKDFFIRGNIAFEGLERLAKFIGFKISFAFAEQRKYEKGKIAFLQKHKNLTHTKEFVNILEMHRKSWFALFIEIRNRIIHEGFKLPNIEFVIKQQNEIKPFFPVINNMTVKEILDICWSNLFTFCEGVMVSLLSFKLPDYMVICEVPEQERGKYDKAKYIISLKTMPGVRLQC